MLATIERTHLGMAQATEEAASKRANSPASCSSRCRRFSATCCTASSVSCRRRSLVQLGAEALAAVGAGQRVFFALQAVMMAIGAGTTALVARAWGRNDEVEAGRITIASLVLGGVFGLVLTIPGVFFSSHVASIFGLDAHTVELAAANIRWLSMFNVAFAANFIMGGALRAAGDAWTPLYVGAFVNVVNIPLLYALVFGLWGAPAMGVAGAALAAGLSFTLGGDHSGRVCGGTSDC